MSRSESNPGLRRELLDADFQITAPEYILFRYSTAGPITRLFAVVLDHLIVLTALLALFLLVLFVGSFLAISLGSNELGGFMVLLLFLLLFAANWLYFILMEGFNRGRTIGKMALGVRVVSVDGSSLDWVQVILRNLVRVADMFPMALGANLFPTYFTGALTSSLSSRAGFRRLGDLAAGTIVVREQRMQPQPKVEEDERIAQLANELHMRRFPSPTLAQGLNDFVARRPRLNPARADEIARAIEADLRKMFGAEQLDCTPTELLLAAHHTMFSRSREELAGLEQRLPGEGRENIRKTLGAPGGRA